MVQTGQAKAEAQRERRKRQREAPSEALVNNEALAGEAPCHVKPHNEAPEVPSTDGHMKTYNPLTDGVDGWHTTDKGMKYVLQDTGMGGMARLYRLGPRMLSYW